jgi:hypothetical protein
MLAGKQEVCLFVYFHSIDDLQNKKYKGMKVNNITKEQKV